MLGIPDIILNMRSSTAICENDACLSVLLVGVNGGHTSSARFTVVVLRICILF